jgi:hypothetical protein
VDKNPFRLAPLIYKIPRCRSDRNKVKWPKTKLWSSVRNTLSLLMRRLSREVVVEKTVDGKESLKITIKPLTLGVASPNQDCTGDGEAA